MFDPSSSLSLFSTTLRIVKVKGKVKISICIHHLLPWLIEGLLGDGHMTAFVVLNRGISSFDFYSAILALRARSEQ